MLKILIETSARHVHVSEDLEVYLDLELNLPPKDLSQPGQYACEERDYCS